MQSYEFQRPENPNSDEREKKLNKKGLAAGKVILAGAVSLALGGSDMTKSSGNNQKGKEESKPKIEMEEEPVDSSDIGRNKALYDELRVDPKFLHLPPGPDDEDATPKKLRL
jgi:hypothetical protein